jgi:hypothetical protein
MLKKSILSGVFLMIMVLNCATPFVWQGQYIKINTTEQPKEDFVVGDYIIIAYAPCEYRKNATRLYKFALIQNGRQAGMIILDRSDFILPVYYLEESGYPPKGNFRISGSANHVTYNQYKKPPDYEHVKGDVTTLILGGDLEPESVGP